MDRPRFVKRPNNPRPVGRYGAYPYTELLTTLDTQRALLLPTSDTLTRQVHAMRRKMMRANYRLRASKHPDGVVVWIERRDSSKTA